MSLSREQRWKLVSLGSAVLAAVVVRGGIRAAWRIARDDEPPLNPLRQDSSWTDTVLFSFATGLSVGLARLGARAVAASAWNEGEPPRLPAWMR